MRQFLRRSVDQLVIAGIVLLGFSASFVPLASGYAADSARVLLAGGLLHGAAVQLCAGAVALRVVHSRDAPLLPILPFDLGLYHARAFRYGGVLIAGVFVAAPALLFGALREIAAASSAPPPSALLGVDFTLVHCLALAVAIQERLASPSWSRLFFAPRAVVGWIRDRFGLTGLVVATVAATLLLQGGDDSPMGALAGAIRGLEREYGLPALLAHFLLVPFSGVFAFSAPGAAPTDAIFLTLFLVGSLVASAATTIHAVRSRSMDEIDEACHARWVAEREEFEEREAELARLAEERDRLEREAESGGAADRDAEAPPNGSDDEAGLADVARESDAGSATGPGAGARAVEPERAWREAFDRWTPAARLRALLDPWVLAAFPLWFAPGLLRELVPSPERFAAVALLMFAWAGAAFRSMALRLVDEPMTMLPMRRGRLVREAFAASILPRGLADLNAAVFVVAALDLHPAWGLAVLAWLQAIRLKNGFSDALRSAGIAGRPLAGELCGALDFVAHSLTATCWLIAMAAGPGAFGTARLAVVASTAPLVVATAVAWLASAILSHRLGGQIVVPPDAGSYWKRAPGRRL